MAIARADAVSFTLVTLAALLSVLFLFLFRRYRTLFLALLVGIAWGSAALFWDAYRVAADESWITGSHRISADIEEVEHGSAYSRLRLTHIRRADGAELAGKAEIYLYGNERKRSLLAGQSIQAAVKLHAPRNKLNPGSFDYRGYCFDRQIALIGSGKGVVVVQGGIPLLERLRQRIVKALPAGDEAAIIRALLLADRDQISNPVQDTFAAAGAAHLLAISGLHVGMVAGWGFMLAWWLLTRRERWIVRLPVRKVALTVGLLMAVAYAAIAGWPITAQRSVLMLAAALLAWWLRSRSRPLNTMLAALMLLLLMDPAAIVSISLWLSFVAVSGLLIWAEAVSGRGETTRLSRLRGWVAGLFWVSVVAAMVTLPIIADIFGRIPTYTLPANLLLVPLYGLYVLPLSMLGEIAAITGGEGVALRLFEWAATGIAYGNSLLAELQRWPAGNLWIPDVPLSVGLLYGLGMMASAYFLLQRKYRHLLLCSTLSLALYLGVTIPESAQESGGQTAELTVWDVGQGAAATLVLADGKVMVIDAPGRYGARHNGGTIVAAGLREMGLVHADLLVLSHAQSDHAGGAVRLLDQLRNVGELWLADVPANRGYPAMTEAVMRISAEGGTVRWLKRGDRVAFGHADAEVLWPPQDFNPGNDNNTSLVLSLRLNSGERLLFPADIEAESEREIVRRTAQEPGRGGLQHHDVALAPHHGSRTSSTPDWVEQIQADVAIVQTGWANHYGFPSPEVVRRYRQQGGRIFDSKYGAVTVRFGGGDENRSVQGIEITQFQPEKSGKRDTALQWWQRAL